MAFLVFPVQTPGIPSASGYPLMDIFQQFQKPLVIPFNRVIQSQSMARNPGEDRICTEYGLKIDIGCPQRKWGHEALESSCCLWDLIPRCTVEVTCNLSKGKFERQQQ